MMNDEDFNADEQPRKTGWSLWKFSLRSILILITLVAIGTAWYQHRSGIVRAIEDVEKLGGTIKYHPDTRPWLTRMTGDLFRNVYSIDFKLKPINDDDLALLGKLPYLEAVYFPRTNIGKSGLKHLWKCKSLRRLSLWSCSNVKDECVDAINRIPQLDTLDVHNTGLTAEGICRLAENPTLKRLIFSTGRSDIRWKEKKAWYTHRHLIALGKNTRLKATMVGNVYLQGVNDESLVCLNQLDTSRTRYIRIRNSQFTDKGMAIFNGLELNGLEFDACGIDADDLRPLDVDFTKTHVTIRHSNLSAMDVIKQFGSRTKVINFGDEHISLARNQVSQGILLTDVQVRFASDCFQYLPNATYLSCESGDSDAVSSLLVALPVGQPSINLVLLLPERNDVDCWDSIRATTSLTSLTVRNVPINASSYPRFTDKHRIKHLDVHNFGSSEASKFAFHRPFFEELAKLKRLETLYLGPSERIGAELEPIVQLKGLINLRIHGIEDDAAEQILRMKLRQLTIRESDLSDNMKIRLSKAPGFILNAVW